MYITYFKKWEAKWEAIPLFPTHVSIWLTNKPLKYILIFHMLTSGGEGGIRTPGPFRVNGFQDRRIRPLCHLSDQAGKHT